jgi:glycosyltransferase involved in cell wall biosynthesis
MKILWISDNPRVNSGYGKITAQTVRYLKSRGHEVLVMAGGATLPNIPFQEQAWEGCRFWQISDYGNAEQVRFFLNKEKPDVVIANADPRFFDYLFKMDNEIRRVCPLVFYHLWDDGPFPKFNIPYYNSCDHIIAGSKFTFNLLKDNSIPENMLSYAPIGFDPKIYHPISNDELINFRQQFNQLTNFEYVNAKFVAGVIARHSERKNLLSMMHAFAKWQEGKDDVVLFVHSPGRDAGRSLQYALQNLFGDKKIVLSNAAPYQQKDELINQFYNFFDVILNRSTAEGFGMPIAEAMLAGTPAISIDCPGPAGLITDENGWLLPADVKPFLSNEVVPFIQFRYITDEKFIAALDEAYNNPTLRLKKAAKCRQYIIDNYSLDNMTRSIEIALQKAISNWTRYSEFSVHTFPPVKVKAAVTETVKESK